MGAHLRTSEADGTHTILLLVCTSDETRILSKLTIEKYKYSNVAKLPLMYSALPSSE
jgi:hypothetical protein